LAAHGHHPHVMMGYVGLVAADLELVDGVLRFVVDPGAYRLTAVKKTGYRLAERCTIVIEGQDDTGIHVRLLFRRPPSESEVRETVRLFFEELLDQELREHVAEETSAVRTLILAHAFSKVDLINRE
jgi:His-Xaa-Ser system protein HxsD